MPIYLNEQHAAEFVDMPSALAVVRAIFEAQARGEAVNIPRTRLAFGARRLNLMAGGGRASDRYAVKSYGSSSYHVLLYSAAHGLLAIMEANLLGQIRTGAASAIATQAMARPNAGKVGIIGAGRQARTQIEALRCVGCAAEVAVFARDRAKQIAFCERLVRELAEERDRQKAERMEADRRLAELRAVFDWEPNGIALFDASGALRMASHRIEQIFGLPLRAMYGQSYEEIYCRKLEQAVPQDREAKLAHVLRIFANRDASSKDDIELERPRHRWLTRSTVPVRGVGGEYLGRLVVYTDVTEQRELDRQRTDFLTVAAHELRTPLTPLSMYLQSIDRRLARGQQVEAELVSKARRQVDRLGRLVEDLLDVSRLESRRMHLGETELDLNELVDDVVADFRGQTRNHDIVFHRAPTAVLVQADQERIEQVLVNLLQNAIKYSPQGGQILVSVQRSGAEARTSVQDPGIGIPRDEQANLFQRFFRAANATTRNYSGLGIGLFISHEIVHHHGGQMGIRIDPPAFGSVLVALV